MDTLSYVRWFRAAAPYINAHSDRTFVLMLGGDAIAHANFENIVHDIALLASLDVRMVVVFGARPQIDAEMGRRGIEPRYQDGLRITGDAEMGIVRGAVGDLYVQMEALLSMGLPGSPMHASRITAAGGNWVIAKPLGVVDGVEFEHTGEVRRVDADAVRRQLDAGVIPLIGPLGYSPSGEVFNLAYQDVAARVAAALRADKLIAFDEERGLLDDDGALVSEMSPGELSAWLGGSAGGRADDERARQVAGAVAASRAGVRRVHFVSYAEDGALLAELFTREGSGTQISEHAYESLRPATPDDVSGIVELTRPLEARGILVARSRERIERDLDCFWVVDLDGLVIACAALYPYPENHAVELACIVTHPEFQGGDRAERLVAHLEARARRSGARHAFILTTRTAHWFLEQGYHPGSTDDLPRARRDQWSPERNSQVFLKTLQSDTKPAT